MPGMLSDFIQTAVGFRAAVNVIQEQDDAAKAAGFLPTKPATEVLFDLGRQLEPKAGQRARLITGTYGTGKSHLALVLTMLYRGRQGDIEPVLGRLGEKYPGQAPDLRDRIRGITPERPYLVVLVGGDQDSFEAALVRGLRAALERAGHGEFMPATYFSAAADRLRELLDDAEAGPRLQKAARDMGIGPPESLLDRLDSEGVELDDLEAFCRLHKQVCYGADFSADTRLNAVETFQQTSRGLADAERFAGITVIWDEFGPFMEQVVRDPTSREGQAVQRFAEACSNSGEYPIHLYLIAHRSLQSYVARLRDTMHLPSTLAGAWEEDFKKVAGRFREFFMNSESEELYSLIDDALLHRRDAGWDEFVVARDNDFTMLTDRAYRANILQDLPSSKLRSMVVEGCYPLSPATAAVLPAISEQVAQNQRTLFTFLCADEPGTVAHYLQETPIPQLHEPLPLIACDKLWDYFEQAIREDRKFGQPIHRRYSRAVGNLGPGADDLTRRLVKAVALFDLLREGDTHHAGDLPATEEVLAFALDLRSDTERGELAERLRELSQPGPSRVMVRTPDRVYRLVSGTGIELSEAVEQKLTERQASLNVARFVRDRWSRGKSKAAQADFRLGFEDCIEALRDDPRVISRTLEVKVLLPEETEDWRPWLSDIGDGQYVDGLMLLALPTDDVHVGALSKKALELADNPQVIMARPSHALHDLREVVARIDALEAVAREEAGLWGAGGERRDEWEADYHEACSRLEETLKPVGLTQHARELALDCFWQGSSRPCRSWADLTELANEAMRTAFRLTPATRDDMMKPAARDGLTAARRAVVDKLLEKEGPRVVIAEKDAAQGRMVRLLEGFGMLKREPRPALGRPDEQHNPGAAAIWDWFDGFKERVQEAPQGVDTVVRALRSAPYGLGQRVLPLVFVAALREDARNGNVVLERRGRGDAWQSTAISGESLDDAFANHQSARFRYENVTDQQYHLVEGLMVAIGAEAQIPPDRRQLLDEAKKQVTLWWHKLPHYCQQTQHLSGDALHLRERILRPLVHPDTNPHEVLVERLREHVKDPSNLNRQQAIEAFAPLVQEIEGACEHLPERSACELQTALSLKCEAVPTGVVDALRKWYDVLPEDKRSFCHPSDAGKLQAWLRAGPDASLEQLCESVMGRALREWGDSDVGHLAGRVQSAKQAIEDYTPPPVNERATNTATRPAQPPPGMATLNVQTNLDEAPVDVQRQFRVIPTEELSETAKVLLRLLVSNLADDHSLSDGERENIILQLIRQVFGDG